MIVVYKIVCTKNGRSYVGYSSDYAKRKKAHLYQLKNGKHHNILVQHDYDKYGLSAFEFYKKKVASLKEAMRIEVEEILSNKHRYNIAKGNFAGDVLTRHPLREQIIEKRSRSQRATNAKLSKEELSDKYGKFGERNGMYGQTHTKEARQRIAEARKGKPGTFSGKSHSNEAKIKIAEKAKLRKGESNSFFGKQHSEETKAKIGNANKGKKPANSLRVKVGKKVYESATAAARDLGCAVATVGNRIKNPAFSEYSYVP